MASLGGLPLHPLLVHAPIALVPAAWVLALVFALRPGRRHQLGPWVVAVAVLAALACLGATYSGHQLAEILEVGDRVERHEELGELTRSAAIVAAAAAIGVVVLDRGWRAVGVLRPDDEVAHGRGVVHPGATLVTSGAALLSVVTTAAVVALGLTGHAGASLTWQDRSAAAARTDGTAARSTDDASPVVVSVAVEVVLGEWDLTSSTSELRPGTHTIRFRNAGTEPHALRLRSEDGGPRREWRSDLVPPGGAGELTVQLTAGTYTLDCPVEGPDGEHDALGMEHALTVHERARSAATASPPSSSGHVEVVHFAFAPQDVEVAVGDEVTWSNGDEATHAASGAGWSTGALHGGERATHRFDVPGRHPYVCDLHPSMTGVVIVHP